MKLKENFKRFWTLSQNRKGFTLVELIVVIAILAILAGVAIPVYNGYIKKAQEAADNQLMDSINTAFAAACIANGYDYAKAKAVLEVDDNGYILKAGQRPAITLSAPSAYDPNTTYYYNSVTIEGVSEDVETVTVKVEAAFAMFFAGNEGAAFKGEDYVGQTITIEGEDVEGSYKVAYGNGYITLNEKAIEALKKTTFYTSLGTAGLMDKISDVTGFAALLGEDSAMQAVYESEAFIEHAASALGLDTSKAGWEDEASAKIEAMAQELADKEGITWGAAYNQIRANAAVIHAAKNASEMNADSVISLLTDGNATAAIQGKLSTDPSAALSEAALAYGMYTAYAHSTGNADLIAKTDDPLYILKNLNDEGFKTYMDSEKGKTDLNGYMSALGMINDTSKDPNAVSSVLVNGFNDAELVSILGSMLDG